MIIYYETLIKEYRNRISKGIATQKEINRLAKLEQWQINSWQK